jgi:hypothetical protein
LSSFVPWSHGSAKVDQTLFQTKDFTNAALVGAGYDLVDVRPHIPLFFGTEEAVVFGKT